MGIDALALLGKQFEYHFIRFGGFRLRSQFDSFFDELLMFPKGLGNPSLNILCLTRVLMTHSSLGDNPWWHESGARASECERRLQKMRGERTNTEPKSDRIVQLGVRADVGHLWFHRHAANSLASEETHWLCRSFL